MQHHFSRATLQPAKYPWHLLERRGETNILAICDDSRVPLELIRFHTIELCDFEPLRAIFPQSIYSELVIVSSADRSSESSIATDRSPFLVTS